MYDKFAGCLLGKCLGDALGYPVEGFPSDACLDYLHSQVKPLWYRKHHNLTHPFGQFTDDSQLARELLISIVECREFSADNYAARMVKLFQANRIVNRGIACNAAMRRMVTGISWQEAGCPPPQAGNGTAMRVAPIAMMYSHDEDTLIRFAREQGWITHRDHRCDAGSVAVALAVAMALEGRLQPAEFLRRISDTITPIHSEFGTAVSRLIDMVPLPPGEVVERASTEGVETNIDTGWPGISPFVVSTVLWSLYCFLHSPDDYYTSIWHSIAVGGDVDTTAAITGAISGAYNGLSSLPNHLLEMLHDHGEWRRAELIALCDMAFAVRSEIS